MFPRFSVFDEMSNLFRNVDNLFRRSLEDARLPLRSEQRVLPAWTEGSQALTATTAPWAPVLQPAVECFARDKQIVVRAELPGVDPNAVEASVTGNQLMIRGEKHAEHQVDENDYFFQEVGYGKFERSFTLPAGVNTEGVKATHRNGVLEIVLPAEGMTAAKKVPIEIAGPERKSIKAA